MVHAQSHLIAWSGGHLSHNIPSCEGTNSRIVADIGDKGIPARSAQPFLAIDDGDRDTLYKVAKARQGGESVAKPFDNLCDKCVSKYSIRSRNPVSGGRLAWRSLMPVD